MKYLLLIVIFTVGWILASSHEAKQSGANVLTPPALSPTVSRTPTPKSSIDVDLAGKQIRVSWFVMDKSESMILLPNYTEKKTATTLIEQNACHKAINAGFYTKENTPIGLFVSQSTKKSNFTQNQTLNGIFAQDEAGNYTITAGEPDAPSVIAVQTGPILYADGQEKRIQMSVDEPNRRSVAALTKQNTVYFLSFYDPNNPYKGPILTDMPQALSLFQSNTNILFSDAINLDGGSASIFYDGSFKLEELTFVGSLFCIR